MIITKLQQFIIFNCDQQQITIPSSLSTKISKITKINPPTGSSLVTWSDGAPVQQLNLLDPNTIYLVTSKEGQLGYEFPGAVDPAGYCLGVYSIPGLYTTRYSGNFDGDPEWFNYAIRENFIQTLTITSESSIISGDYYRISDNRLSSATGRTYINWNNETKKYELIVPHCEFCLLSNSMDDSIFDCTSCVENYNNLIYDLDSDLDSDELKVYFNMIESKFLLSENLINWTTIDGQASTTFGESNKSLNFEYTKNLENQQYKNNSIEMIGYFKPKISGEYIFSVNSNGNFLLWIGEKQQYTVDNCELSLNSNSIITVDSDPILLNIGVGYPIKIQYFTNSEVDIKYKVNTINVQVFDETLGWEDTLESDGKGEEPTDVDFFNESEECVAEDFQDSLEEEDNYNLDNGELCQHPKTKGIIVLGGLPEFAPCDCYETSDADPLSIIIGLGGLILTKFLGYAKGNFIKNISKLNKAIGFSETRSTNLNYKRDRILEIIYRIRVRMSGEGFSNQSDNKLLEARLASLERSKAKVEQCLEVNGNRKIDLLEKLEKNLTEMKGLEKIDHRANTLSGGDWVKYGPFIGKFLSGQIVVTPKVCSEIPSADNPGFGGASETATPELNRDTCECENCPQGFALGQGYYPLQGPDTEGSPYCFKCDPELERCGIVANFDDPVNRTGGKCGCASGYELMPCINGCNVGGQYVKCASSLPPDCLNTITCFNSKFEWDDNLCDWSCKEDNCSSNQIQSILNCECLDCPPEAPVADKASNKCVCPVSPEDCLASEIFEESLCECISSSYGGFGQNGI